MFSVDLHVHTRPFHGWPERATLFDPLGARLNGTVARQQGIDALALTNHDYAARLDLGQGVTTIPGIEITTTHGHLLVVGPDPPDVTKTGELTPAEAVDLAHEGNCAAIMAHPYRNSTVRDTDADVDAVELNGKHPHHREWIGRLATARGLPVVGGSDAHYPVEVGRAYTEIEAEELTPASVAAAIRDGRVEPRVTDWWPHRGIRRAYRAIHDRKGWLQQPEEPTPGVGTPPGEEDADESTHPPDSRGATKQYGRD